MATIFLSSRENSILSLVEHPHAFSIYSLVGPDSHFAHSHSLTHTVYTDTSLARR